MKEKILGKTVGKVGISQVLIIKTTFIMTICIILGFFLVISSLVNWGKNYFYLNLENGSDNVGFLVIEVENKENLTKRQQEVSDFYKWEMNCFFCKKIEKRIHL